MESLLLFCRALSSPTMCRFIPALSVPEKGPGCQVNVSENLEGSSSERLSHTASGGFAVAPLHLSLVLSVRLIFK
jgi:hypothetical protein